MNWENHGQDGPGVPLMFAIGGGSAKKL